MKKTTNSSPYQFEGRIPLSQAIPLGLQHVMAMFIGNLTPLIIVMGACGLTADAGFAELRTALLQNAMIIAGIVTLVQMFSIGPIGGKVPIVMGTSSGFLGVLNNTVAACGGGVIAYGAIMGACIVGGIFEGILGAFLKPLRKFFPAIVTGSVVIAIGLSLLGVGINYFCGGTGKNDYGSLPNLFLGMVVLIVIVLLKHFAPSRSIFSSSAILFGILAGYVVAIIMTLTMSHTGVTADGVKYTYSWVVNFDEVKNAAWIAVPSFIGFGKLSDVGISFHANAIIPIGIMFIVTAIETVGDISACVEGGMDREATDSELSGGVICDGLGSSFAALFSKLHPDLIGCNYQIFSFLLCRQFCRNRLVSINGLRIMFLCSVRHKNIDNIIPYGFHHQFLLFILHTNLISILSEGHNFSCCTHCFPFPLLCFLRCCIRFLIGNIV